MKKALVTLALLGAASVSFANSNTGCGLGSMIFTGKNSTITDILAITTNGSSGNQTFGISSGTLGCSQGPLMAANDLPKLYIEGNQDQLMAALSSGKGETLDGLGQALGIPADKKDNFQALLKQNFSTIVTNPSMTSMALQANLKTVLDTSEFKAQSALL